MIEEFAVETKQKQELVNITQELRSAVFSTGIQEGLAIIFLPHATAGFLVNEDEAGLKSDFIEFFESLMPQTDLAHNRIDNNAQAHLLSGLLGQSKSLIIENGDLVLGVWQSIFLVELDGPRTRRVQVQAIRAK